MALVQYTYTNFRVYGYARSRDLNDKYHYPLEPELDDLVSPPYFPQRPLLADICLAGTLH